MEPQKGCSNGYMELYHPLSTLLSKFNKLKIQSSGSFINFQNFILIQVFIILLKNVSFTEQKLPH
jgi:hypothetical protein